MFVCKYVWNLYKFTFLNQTLHTSPPWSGRDRRVCMGLKFLTSSTFWALFSLGATAESWAQDGCRCDRFLRYPWFQLVFAWRHRHYVVADGRVIHGSLISVILAGVPLTSRKLRRSRWQNHLLQHRILYSSGCLYHVTDITFNWATGPPTTALYPSF